MHTHIYVYIYTPVYVNTHTHIHTHTISHITYHAAFESYNDPAGGKWEVHTDGTRSAYLSPDFIREVEILKSQ